MTRKALKSLVIEGFYTSLSTAFNMYKEQIFDGKSPHNLNHESKTAWEHATRANFPKVYKDHVLYLGVAIQEFIDEFEDWDNIPDNVLQNPSNIYIKIADALQKRAWLDPDIRSSIEQDLILLCKDLVVTLIDRLRNLSENIDPDLSMKFALKRRVSELFGLLTQAKLSFVEGSSDESPQGEPLLNASSVSTSSANFQTNHL